MTLTSSRGLRADTVSVAYGSSTAVDRASLRLPRGQVSVLIGPNGSGKSTLLRGIASLQPMASGSVDIDGVSTRALSRRELARRLTMLTQGRPTPAGLTVREVVEFGRHPYRGRWRANDTDGREAVDRALALTEVAELHDRDVDTLSGGQLQRVWLAACLAQDTDVLLLDEPTTYLDLRHQVELLSLIRSLAATHSVTVGVVLHDLNQAADIADHVVLLHEGQIVAAGAPSAVLDPQTLTRVYEIPITVVHDPVDDVVTIAPQRARRDLDTPSAQD